MYKLWQAWCRLHGSTVEHLFTATTDGIGPKKKYNKVLMETEGLWWNRAKCDHRVNHGVVTGKAWKGATHYRTKNPKNNQTYPFFEAEGAFRSVPFFFHLETVDQKNMSFQRNQWLQRVEIRAVNHQPNNRADSLRSDIIGTSLCQCSRGQSKNKIHLKKKKAQYLQAFTHLCLFKKKTLDSAVQGTAAVDF